MQIGQLQILIEGQLRGTARFFGAILLVGGRKKQSVVARSSVEVVFQSIAQGVCEILWLMRVLEELKRPISFPMKLYCDNNTAICIAHNPIQDERLKHVAI